MDLSINADGVALKGVDDGEGTPVVLLHGLTATRRYVVMGSKALERSGHRVIAYDARAHGQSDPGDDYGYDRLAKDLLAILDDREIDKAVLAGASMGAHTITKFALQYPDRVAALVIMTPAYDPEDERNFDRWDSLAKGLREGGVEGFVKAYGTPNVPEKWHETIDRVLHQRLSAHEHPEALADALEEVPRSRPFEDWDDLERHRRRRRPSSPAATRSTPSTRTRSGSATQTPSRTPSSSPRRRASRRWPGRARRCRR